MGLFLPLYFAVISLMPLSNIHIEGLSESSYLNCKAPRGVDIHLLLHEMLFAHFGHKLEYLRNASATGFSWHKEELQDHQSGFPAVVDSASFSRIISSEKLVSPDHIRTAQRHLCFISSGLSPPSA